MLLTDNVTITLAEGSVLDITGKPGDRSITVIEAGIELEIALRPYVEAVYNSINLRYAQLLGDLEPEDFTHPDEAELSLISDEVILDWGTQEIVYPALSISCENGSEVFTEACNRVRVFLKDGDNNIVLVISDVVSAVPH